MHARIATAHRSRDWRLEIEPHKDSSLRAALQPAALRAALKPGRPVFRAPWDSPGDMFLCYLAVSVISPWLLFGGAELMSLVFGGAALACYGTLLLLILFVIRRSVAGKPIFAGP
jgi:hypothetical protein